MCKCTECKNNGSENKDVSVDDEDDVLLNQSDDEI